MSLHRLLKIRHGGMLASYWEGTVAVTSKVRIMSIACAQMRRFVSYFVTTSRSVKACEEKYLANFEDDFGSIASKEISRLSICHFSCKPL